MTAPPLFGLAHFEPAQQTSTDAQYLAHEFQTWQGWQESRTGWTPAEAREAVDFHLKGWPYLSASLARHLPRFSLIFGALTQRTAPPLRTTWRQERSRGAKWIAAELEQVWARQFRPAYEEKLRDAALLGGSPIHIHWVDDVAAGVRRPVLKRWPHEAMFWRSASPAFPGGWYAITADSGLVRMNFGDGHWAVIAHGERWHEFGAVIALGELFVSGKLSERDEAGLSEAAGRASPIAELKEGVAVDDEIGKAVQAMVAGLGRARKGGVVPAGTKVTPFQITSDTDFFASQGERQLLKVGLVILGQAASLGTGDGTYKPIVAWSPAAALSDKDHEATVRCWDLGIVRPFLDQNGVDSDVGLVGERYVDPNAKAEAEAKRAALLSDRVKGWRDAGMAPTQTDVDALASRLSTPTIQLGSLPPPPTTSQSTAAPTPPA